MLLIVEALVGADTVYPGKIYSFECTKDNKTGSIVLLHENTNYYISLSVESDDGASMTGFASDGKENKTIAMGMRTSLSNFEAKSITVNFTCATEAGTLYFHYFDNRVIHANQAISGIKKTEYLMFPICHEDKAIKIRTKGSVVVSNKNSRPAQNDSDTLECKEEDDLCTISGKVVETLVGFLYINYTPSAQSDSITVYQYEPEEVVYNTEVERQISSMEFCYDNYKLTAKDGDHVIIVAADDSMRGNALFPSIYFKNHYTEGDVCIHNNSDIKSLNTGVLDINPEDYPLTYEKGDYSDVAITMGLNTKYMPIRDAKEHSYMNHSYSLYLTNNCTYLLPGERKSVSVVGGKVMDYAVLYKRTTQCSYVDGELERTEPKYSSYIVEYEDDTSRGESDASDVILDFGWNTPGDHRANTSQTSPTKWSGEARYDPEKPAFQLGDIFYARVHSKSNTTLIGHIRAEHSYLLRDRLQYKFTPDARQSEERFFASFNASAGKGMELQITEISGRTMTVYVSQKVRLPGDGDADVLVQRCQTGEKVCTVVFDALDSKLPVYIGFATDKSFKVIAGPKDRVMTQLHEFRDNPGRLNMSGPDAAAFAPSEEFIFIPTYRIYTGQLMANDYMLATLELEAAAVRSMQRHAFDVVALIGYDPDPDESNHVARLSMSSGIALNPSNAIEARKHVIVPVLHGEEIFVTVKCDGTSCGSNLTNISFNLRVNTMNQLPEYSSSSNFYLRMRDDGHSQAGYFHTEDHQTALLRIYGPRQVSGTWGADSPIDCEEVEFTAILCIGTMPSSWEENNHEQIDSCWSYNYTMGQKEGYLEFDLDSSRAKVAAGTVFFKVLPRFDKLSGRADRASNCATKIELFKNEEISDMNVPLDVMLYAETGVSGAAHLMVDVPILMGAAAVRENGYGDRVLFNYASDQPIMLCISDSLENPYPAAADNGECGLYSSSEPSTAENLTLYYRKYMNRRGTGSIHPSTRIYITAWAACTDCKDMEGFMARFTVISQGYMHHKNVTNFSFTSRSLFGVSRYANFAIDLKGLQKRRFTVITGPNCNYAQCRANIPESFYHKNLITYYSFVQTVPCASTAGVMRHYHEGMELMHLDTMLDRTNVTANTDTLYVTLEYRHSHKLNEFNTKSNLSYVVYLLENYSSANQLQYQAFKNVVKDISNSAPIDYYHANMYYNPSEVVLFPCRGRPSILIDHISPKSNPQDHDYEEMISGPWGHPISHRYNNDTFLETKSFFSVFDMAIFDYERNEFIENQSQMMYEIFVGAQAEINTPGNSGQLTVVHYSSSGSGKITVRFTPAKEPNQKGDISHVNYKLMVIPYQGSFDHERDSSPYTACGVEMSGYSVYENEYGVEYITQDDKFIEKNGYIEVTSNLPLWRDTKSGSILYVTVLAGKAAYMGTLVGDGTMSMAALLAISILATIGVAVVLFVVFWALFVRVKRVKEQGYKPIVM